MEFNATFIVSAISFIVFTLIMNAIFYKPLNNVVAERQKFVDDALQEAKFSKEKSEAILKDKEKQLSKTKHDAKKIIHDKSELVKAQKESMTGDAHQKAIKVVDEAKMQLQTSKEDAQKVLDGEVQKLAQEISSKILGNV